MPKFLFRLEPVLGFREQVEQSASQRLAAAQKEYDLWVEARTETRRRLEAIMEPVPEKGMASVDVAGGLHRMLFQQFLTNRMETQLENMVKAGRQMEECRNDLVEARRERLVLEKLKEKKYFEYLSGVAAAEQKLSDDLAQRKKIKV